MAKLDKNGSFEKDLFKSADALRKNMDASEYKHVVLGLIFLKYISDAFIELFNKLTDGKGEYLDSNPEDKDEYLAENVFFVPKIARWNYIQEQAKNNRIGIIIDDAMLEIEKENPSLKGVLPKVYARPNLDKNALGTLIDLIAKIALGDAQSRAKDVLGRVYEYFLGQFALLEGKKGGQFYTPESIVKLLVEMLEPYNGRVFDPCCGSGGMFVQSEKFIKNHQGRLDNISIYGQESNQTTWRLCKMNLAIRSIDASNIKWNNEGSFINNEHKGLKADYIIANPPFNDSDWNGDLLREDVRWKYGVPPTGNANYAWVQHFIFHLAPNGIAGFVLSNGSLSSNTSGEGEIRRKIIEDNLVDCVVMLPAQLFYNTGIPACLWFLNRAKTRLQRNNTLFIDASELGFMIDRRNKAFDYEKDILKVANTYRDWKKNDGTYQDIKGYCKSANLEEIKKHNYVLTPGRYVGIPDEIDDGIPFEVKMNELICQLKVQMEESKKLDEEIKKQLAKVGFEI